MNEDPNAKMIRELKEELEMLRSESPAFVSSRLVFETLTVSFSFFF